jgi:hypothetical protein
MSNITASNENITAQHRYTSTSNQAKQDRFNTTRSTSEQQQHLKNKFNQ